MKPEVATRATAREVITKRVYPVKKNMVLRFFLPYNLHLFFAGDKMIFTEENH
jgi:hypothetical protein